MPLELTQENLLTYLFSVHNLTKKVDNSQLLSLFDLTGFRITSKESLAVALNARAKNITANQIENLFSEGQLISVFNLDFKIRALSASMWHKSNASLQFYFAEELDFLLKGSKPYFKALPLTKTELLELVIKIVKDAPFIEKDKLLEYCAQRLLEVVDDKIKEILSWPISNQNGSTLVFKIVEALIPIASLFKPVFALYENQLKPKEIKKGSLFVDYLKGCALGDYLKFASFAKISDNQSFRLYTEADKGQFLEAQYDNRSGYVTETLLNSLSDNKNIEGLRLIANEDPLIELAKEYLPINGKKLYNYFFKGEKRPSLVFYDGKLIGSWRYEVGLTSWSIVIEDLGLNLQRVATSEIEKEVASLELSFGKKCSTIKKVEL
jgi:hypothetical protein